MVQTPVGARCRECARLRRLPTFEVEPVHYLRASLAGLGLALALGFVWGFFMPWIRVIPFLPWVVFLLVGYLIGEGISLSVNRKRGRGLQAMAAGSMLLSYAVSGYLWVGLGFWGLLFPLEWLVLLLAVFLAASRLR
jgi:hypothetical protein